MDTDTAADIPPFWLSPHPFLEPDLPPMVDDET